MYSCPKGHSADLEKGYTATIWYPIGRWGETLFSLEHHTIDEASLLETGNYWCPKCHAAFTELHLMKEDAEELD